MMNDGAQPKTKDFKFGNMTGLEGVLAVVGALGVLGLGALVVTDASRSMMWVALVVMFVGTLGSRVLFWKRVERH